MNLLNVEGKRLQMEGDERNRHEQRYREGVGSSGVRGAETMLGR